MAKIWSRVANANKKIACDNPDCKRTDRPLYVWHGASGKDSILLCDICTIRSLPKDEGEPWPKANEMP